MEYSLVYVPFPEVFVRSTGLPVYLLYFKGSPHPVPVDP